jgi:hypothetical protein
MAINTTSFTQYAPGGDDFFAGRDGIDGRLICHRLSRGDGRTIWAVAAKTLWSIDDGSNSSGTSSRQTLDQDTAGSKHER